MKTNFFGRCYKSEHMFSTKYLKIMNKKLLRNRTLWFLAFFSLQLYLPAFSRAATIHPMESQVQTTISGKVIDQAGKENEFEQHFDKP